MKTVNKFFFIVTLALLFGTLSACHSTGDIPVITDHQHTYGEWKNVKEATCLCPGEKHRICSECKDIQIEMFSATSHDFYDHVCKLCSTEANEYWYDESETEFHIGNLEDLRGVAKLVNNGTDFKGKTIILSNDIDLLYRQWIPIGTREHPFRGTFDGNEKTLTNLTINEKTDYEYKGLFGVNEGTIKNLNINNSNIRLASGKYVGSVAALCVGGNITNVKVTENDIFLSGIIDSYIGGLVGAATNNSIIEGCGISGGTLKIQSGKAKIGGLVGMCDSSIVSHSYVNTEQMITSKLASYGGLVGYNVNSDISNCYVQNKINAVITISEIGGLIGYNKDSTVENSYARVDFSNTRNVIILIESVNLGDAALRPTKKYIGGLIGQNENSTVSSCFTRGDHFISASETKYGAIIAEADDSEVIDCYYSGHLSTRGDVIETTGIGELTTGNLIRENEMGWPEEIWSFDTNMPTLK